MRLLRCMKTKICLLSVPLMLVFVANIALSMQVKFTLSKAAEQALREQAKQMADAAQREDDAAVVRFMYPKVVKIMGGEEQARKKVEAARLSVKTSGGSIISTATGDIRGCVKAPEGIQCVLDGNQIMRISGIRLNTSTETLAFSSDDGGHWTFLNGGQGPEALRKNLPELSPDLPLRKQAEPKIEQN
jgi:hypothetical protein